MKEIEGLTTPMLVKLGENEVKTVEDLAGCATDDLVGWTEKDQKHPGYLSRFRPLARAGRGHRHGRARQGGLGRGGGAGAEAEAEPETVEGEERRSSLAGARRDRGAGLRERTCVVTGETGSPETMLRFALSPDGAVTPDIRRKLPGRGVWTRLDAAVVARAAKGFARGFRRPVRVNPDLAREVDALLESDALQFLALVNKSGLVVAGAAKVEASVRSGRAVALLHAREGADDGVDKLDRLAYGLGRSVATINLFELGAIEFGIGTAKCDTCRRQCGAGECGLPRQNRAPERLQGGQAGRTNPGRPRPAERSRRRDEHQIRVAGTTNDGNEQYRREVAWAREADFAFEAPGRCGHCTPELFPRPQQGCRGREETPRHRSRRDRAAAGRGAGFACAQTRRRRAQARRRCAQAGRSRAQARSRRGACARAGLCRAEGRGACARACSAPAPPVVAKPAAAAPAPAAAPVAPRAPTRAPAPPPPRTGVVLQTLTEEQREARARALNDARSREEEDRRRQEAEAAIRRERETRERIEREAAEARKREEELRRQQEASFKKASEEEARRRLAGGEPAPAPAAPPPRKAPPVTAPVPAAATAAPARPQSEGVEARPTPPKRTLTPISPVKPMLATPRPARSGAPRERGRLTVTTATSAEEERTRSVAAFRRRTQRLKGHGHAESKEKIAREIVLPEMITIQELASRMSERAVDVIKLLMRQGKMVTLTDSLDADTAQLIAEDMGHTVKRVAESDVEEGLFENPEEVGDAMPRPPVVTIMGHVDHGKTSLLDAIRNARVVEGEAGGITQHIGAYQVVAPGGEKITFIDTPGHAAFTAMRARGAKVTDIVVLVVAADDGVMPQTIEAIKHAKAANAPIIVAINKIDKPDANPQRVMQELLQYDVQTEEFGGDTLAVPVSALKHTNLDKLLEAIALQAELLDLAADPAQNAEGTVIEARLDRGRGPVASLLVQRGTLKVGAIVVAGSAWGRVRALVNDKGESISEATPSTPVEVLGFSGAPEAGDRVAVVENEARAREITEYRERQRREKLAAKGAGAARTSLSDMLSQLEDGRPQGNADHPQGRRAGLGRGHHHRAGDARQRGGCGAGDPRRRRRHHRIRRDAGDRLEGRHHRLQRARA